MTDDHQTPSRASAIAFGLDRTTDEHSLALFLERFTRPELLGVLLPRLHDREIEALLNQLSGILKNHLRESEYHRLFLKDK